MKSKFCLFAATILLACQSFGAGAGAAAKARAAQKATARLNPSGASSGASTRGLASAGGGEPVEVRGQSRSLSMMLVLKNGKEGINFIKVRKDYAAEISGTSF